MAAVTLVRTLYTITQTDINNGFAAVPIVFKSPFNDTNYNAVFSIEDLDLPINLSWYEGDIHNKTRNGFSAVVYAYSPGMGTAGDKVNIAVIAMHD